MTCVANDGFSACVSYALANNQQVCHTVNLSVKLSSQHPIDPLHYSAHNFSAGILYRVSSKAKQTPYIHTTQHDMTIRTARILLVVALAALCSTTTMVVVEATPGKVGSEERRLFGWTLSASEREEKYQSIYCRCCGSEEGARTIDAAAIPECDAYAGETCQCPVREETGEAWWNFFGTDYQERWNDSCRTTIPERANIASMVPEVAGGPVTAPPLTDAVDLEDGLTVTATTTIRNGGGN